MDLDLAKEMNELIVLNGLARNFEGPLGFRTSAVHCISRDERPIFFAEPETIKHHIEVCLAQFNRQIHMAHDLMQLAQASAYFWMTFICIHPFLDGNGRTAKAYITKSIEKNEYSMRNFDLIDRYLLTGDIQNDLKKLTALFIVSLVPLRSESQTAQNEVG